MLQRVGYPKTSCVTLFWLTFGAAAPYCPAQNTRHVPGQYPTIQAGIDAAANGDTVVVADGTYTGPGNRDLDFAGRAITVRSAGGAANCIIDCQAAGRAFHFHSGETAAARVDGFTVRDGLALYGSAILCELGSAPTITNCVFTGNHATAVWPEIGGALACLASRPTIVGCVFQANTTAAGPGGAVACVDGGDAEFTDCRFEDNTAFTTGALLIERSSPKLTDCLFIRNEADSCCGAGVAYDNASVQLTRCAFLENVDHGQPNSGAGGFDVQLNSRADVHDCVFIGNSTASGGGGLVCLDHSEVTLTNTTFLGNVATGNAGGGFVVNSNSRADVRDCAFIGNVTALGGGGIWCGNDSDLTLTNSTFSSNVAGSGNGGAVRLFQNTNGTANLLNCTLWNNSPNEISLNLAAITVTYSDVRNGWPGMGNISADPMFVRNPDPGSDGVWGTPDDDYGDLHLTPGSPCIDAGDPAFTPQACEHDLDSAIRVWDGNGDAIARVDMGAYEFDAPRGDLNGDGQVNSADVPLFVQALLDPSGFSGCDINAADLNGDGLIDGADTQPFLAALLAP